MYPYFLGNMETNGHKPRNFACGLVSALAKLRGLSIYGSDCKSFYQISFELMKFILGTKEQMTQIFDENGFAQPVTILKVSPAKITQVRTTEKDGYEAVQIASGEQKDHRVTKAEKGHLGAAYKHVVEFRPRTGSDDSVADYETGAELDASVFEAGDTVVVSATSKGKGFQGGVKRHGFAGHNSSHGTKHAKRQPGSIGSTGPQRVFKGTRMAGRMGSDRVTVKNLKAVAVDAENNLLLIKGAIPGRRGSLVEVRSA